MVVGSDFLFEGYFVFVMFVEVGVCVFFVFGFFVLGVIVFDGLEVYLDVDVFELVG